MPVYPKGSALGSLLYLLYTAELPTLTEAITATQVNNSATLAKVSDPNSASKNLQTNLDAIQKWF
jgi:hypothetical protein